MYTGRLQGAVHLSQLPVEVGSCEDGYDSVRGGHRGVSPALLELVVHVAENSADAEQNLQGKQKKQKHVVDIICTTFGVRGVHEQLR